MEIYKMLCLDNEHTNAHGKIKRFKYQIFCINMINNQQHYE